MKSKIHEYLKSETKNVMSKTKILFFIFVFLRFFTNAQSPAYQWVNGIGGTGNETISKGLIDANGNVFVTGTFNSPTLTFGTITLTNNPGTPGPGANSSMYLAKYNASGSIIWAKAVGANGDVVSSNEAVDANGNVLVTGVFSSPTVTFGSVTLTNTNTNLNEEMFVVKYDPNGAVLWAKSAGGIKNDFGRGVATDAGGNVFVAGTFGSSLITVGATTLINSGTAYNDLFIVKYDANGNIIWAKSGGGTSDDQSFGFTADVNGNTFLTGFSQSTSLTFGTTTLAATGFNYMFIAKFDPNGTVLWAKNASSIGSMGSGVACDANGNVLVTGFFTDSTIGFGATTLTNTTAPNTGNCDIFIVKYDAVGNTTWAKGIGGTGDDEGTGIATDAFGNVIVTGGFFSSSIAFGSTTLTNTNSGTSDILIARFDAAGNAIWAKSAGGSSNDGGSYVTIDANQNVFLTGAFTSSSITFGSNALTNSGNVNDPNFNQDVFILKIQDGLTGIPENNFENSILTVFPNPANMQITIEANTSAQLTVELFDASDKLVFNKNIVNKESIDVRNFREGIYMLRVKTDKGFVTKKLVVMSP